MKPYRWDGPDWRVVFAAIIVMLVGILLVLLGANNVST